MSESLCYDGYNQSAHTEVSMTLRSANGGGERNDACPKVAYGFNPVMSGVMMETKPAEETAQTLRKSPGGENGVLQLQSRLALSQMRYIVRRLTPTECERLMGLPDGYTIPTGLRRFFDANGEPTPELVAEFQRIHDTFNAIMYEYAHAKWEREGRRGKEPKPPKPKSAKQVADWLKKISDPATCPDSPRYRGCGNGMATNQPRWIFTRMLTMEGIEW